MAVTTQTPLPYPQCLPSRRQELAKALFSGVAPDVDISQEPRFLEPSAHQEAECAQHDGYFGVQRVVAPAALLTSIRDINAQIEAHMAADGSTINDLEVKRTLFGSESILKILADSDLLSATSWPRMADIPTPDSYSGKCVDPMEHWLLGHRMFFVLIQSIIIALRCFKSDWSDGCPAGAVCNLASAALLCRSTGVAMTYAAAFDADVYEEKIRPSMLPPAVNEGFSGLQTRDHRMLIEVMKGIRPELTQAAESPEVSIGLADFRAALNDMYRAHGYVCAHFRGESNPSLRMEARAQGKSGRPGLLVVNEIAASRMSIIPSPTPFVPTQSDWDAKESDLGISTPG